MSSVDKLGSSARLSLDVVVVHARLILLALHRRVPVSDARTRVDGGRIHRPVLGILLRAVRPKDISRVHPVRMLGLFGRFA